MRVKLNILIVMLALSINGFSQEDTSAIDENAGKKEAILTLQLGANDTMHVATATLIDAVTKLSIKDVEIIFYVPRTFGPMEVGTGTTDTAGNVSIEFPLDTRASDKSQKLVVGAKVEDNDNIRNVTALAETKSQIPFPVDKPVPRSIMGAKAPWWLIISFWGAVGAIYGLFMYVIILVYKIRKTKNHSLILK